MDNNTGVLSREDLIKLLREARDMLVMASLIDKSGQCIELADKIDKKLPPQTNQ